MEPRIFHFKLQPNMEMKLTRMGLPNNVVTITNVLADKESTVRCRVKGEEYAIAVVKPDQRIVPMKLDLFDDMEIFATDAIEIDVLGYISGMEKNPSITSVKKKFQPYDPSIVERNKAKNAEMEKAQKENAAAQNKKAVVPEQKKPEEKEKATAQIEKAVVPEQKKPEIKKPEEKKNPKEVKKTNDKKVEAENAKKKSPEKENKTAQNENKIQGNVQAQNKNNVKSNVQNENKKENKIQKVELNKPAENKNAKEVKKSVDKKLEALKTKEPKPEAKPEAEKPVNKKIVGAGVQVEVLKVGKGQIARPGNRVLVRYDGRLASNGKRFDKGSIPFRLGLGEVIRGWDEGVKGMMVGEKRKLLIPSHAAYGPRGAPPDIPPNAKLVFDVELLQVH